MAHDTAQTVNEKEYKGIIKHRLLFYEECGWGSQDNVRTKILVSGLLFYSGGDESRENK
jgi:hypothetical protein